MISYLKYIYTIIDNACNKSTKQMINYDRWVKWDITCFYLPKKLHMISIFYLLISEHN